MLDESKFTTSADRLTVNFTTEAGRTENLEPHEAPLVGKIYHVVWNVTALDGWDENHIYRNLVNITVTSPDGVSNRPIEQELAGQSGGGNVIGSTVGRVYISKHIDGDNPPPLHSTYDVNWKACDTNNNYSPPTHTGADCREGQTTLTYSGDPNRPNYARIGDFPNGWRVVATEAPPSNIPPNTEWTSSWEWVDKDGNPVPGSTGPQTSLDTTIGTDIPLAQAGYFRVTNTFVQQETEGRFSAQKAFTPAAEGTGFDLDAEEYTLNYSYPASNDYVPGQSGFPGDTGTLTLRGDGSLSYSEPVPIGAVITFSEPTLPDVPGIDWGQATISPQTLVIAEGTLDTPAVITVTNDASESVVDLGHFEVRKTVNGTANTEVSNSNDLYFTMNYTVQEPGEAPRNESIRVPANGQLVSSPEYPVDTVIIITGEDTASLPTIPGTEWGTPTWTPNQITIVHGEDAAVEVALTNTLNYTVGSFQARKAFGDTEGLDFTDETFVLSYEYDAGADFPAGNGTLELKGNGQIATSGPLPIGAELRFEELDPQPIDDVIWGTPTVNPATLTITPGLNLTDVITVTNTASLAPSPGRFTAQKSFNYPNGDAELMDLGALSFTLNYWYTPVGETDQGPFTIQVSGNGDPVLSELIPDGATVRVEENLTARPDVPGATWGAATVTPNTFVMDEGQTGVEILISVENTITKDLGNFQMQKLIDNPDAVDIDGAPFFTVNYDYYYGDTRQGSESLLLSATGNAVASIDHPLGTRIVITGENSPPIIPNAEWAEPVFAPQEFEITGSGETAQLITVTNSISQKPGTFSALKDLTNDDGLYLEWFTFDITYEYEFNGTTSGPFTKTLDANGDSELSASIPIGATVRILGEEPPTEVNEATWEPAVITPMEFQIPEEGADPVKVTVENTITIDRGVFSAQKQIINDENVVIPEITPGGTLPYGFYLSYTYTPVKNIPGGNGAIFMSPDGTVATSDEIPYGATVTVSEIDPLELEGTTWREPVITATPALDESSFVMSADTDQILEVIAENNIYRESLPFWAQKEFNLDSGVTLQEDIEEFELEYTYTFPWVDENSAAEARGGTDTLLLKFNPETGEPIIAESIDLPHGTEVNIRELLPEAPNGLFWQDPVIENQEFTITAGAFEFVTVTATNTLSEIPPSPLLPPWLEKTGATFPHLILALALILLGVGSYLSLRRRTNFDVTIKF